MCFQCTLLVCETYESWMNKFCMISINKLWNVKFVMPAPKTWFLCGYIH
jgi:hypothetical protein